MSIQSDCLRVKLFKIALATQSEICADFNSVLTNPPFVMNTMGMTSTKPYLLRAIFEWAEDNDLTPQLLVDAEIVGVEVPKNHVVDGQIVLNICSTAVHLHTMDNQCVSFSARFSGVEQDIYLPIESIMAIFARENSHGIFFEDMDDDGTDPDEVVLTDVSSGKVKKKPGKAKRDTSHLKIIK